MSVFRNKNYFKIFGSLFLAFGLYCSLGVSAAPLRDGFGRQVHFENAQSPVQAEIVRLTATQPPIVGGGTVKASQFAISLYHWNIQYVSGSRRTEDAIVVQSFDPLLDLFLAHPDWKSDFEMQGYMVEVLADRHPEVLKKLKVLVDNGQIELVSCHYSDQIVLAYPRRDQEVSMKINAEVFKKYRLAVSPVVFLQEDSIGDGIADVMLKDGKDIAVVFGGWDQFKIPVGAPYYVYAGLKLILAMGPDGGDRPNWAFTGDAELAITGRFNNPYFASVNLDFLFKTSQKKIRKMIHEMEDLNKSQIRSVTITEYIQAMQLASIDPIPAGPILDKMRGTNTNNVWLWLGDNRNPFAENDVLVRSENSRSRSWLLAAETALNWAQKNNLNLDLSDSSNPIEDLWRTQLMAEVSDASGLGFPFPIEVKTSLRQSREVISKSQKLLQRIKDQTKGPVLWIDTHTGVVRSVDTEEPFFPMGERISKGPIEIDFHGVAYNRIIWRKVSHGLWKLNLSLKSFVLPLPFLNTLALSFHRFDDVVAYSPALLEDRIVRFTNSEIKFKEIYLPLSNGLIGLGRDFYVIKNNSKSHVAAQIQQGGQWISFKTRCPPLGSQEWEFYVFQGSEQDALEIADRLNVHPIVNF